MIGDEWAAADITIRRSYIYYSKRAYAEEVGQERMPPDPQLLRNDFEVDAIILNEVAPINNKQQSIAAS